MKSRIIATTVLLIRLMIVLGQTPEDTVGAQFVRDRFHQGHLTTWLDAMDDHTVMQGLHTGHWDELGQLMFSVDGNSYRWNKYYRDGFRVDNRFQAGSTLYVPSLEDYNMRMNTHGSILCFELDSAAPDYASISWNRGNLGGINPTTEGIVHLFHGTGTEGAYDKSMIKNRQYVRGVGTADVAYTLHNRKGQNLRQHLLVAAGQRQYPNYDHDGLLLSSPLYSAEAYKVQMDGVLPSGHWLDKLGYLVNFSATDNYGADFYLNPNEVADLKTYSASLYAKRKGLTTGLTWSTNVTRHEDLNFSRNYIDQDGESMEPWSSDGETHELSWAVTYNRHLLPWLSLSVDSYNSLFSFRPKQTAFSNEVYMQQMLATSPTSLYRCEWSSHGFTAGLLENRATLEALHSFSPKFTLSGSLGISIDGMLLTDKTKVSPNLLASVGIDWNPARWLQIGVNLSHDRASYNIEDIRYLSNDYLSGDVYFSGTNRLFTTTGGKRHHYDKHLQQPAYVTFDVPIRLRFGRHEIALFQTFKKYYHVWMTQFEGGPDANGYYENGYYFLNPGTHEYVIGYQPTELMGNGFFTSTPYYMSQLSRYTYVGRKFMFSLSWQSMMGVGLSALGHGPAANNIGVLSETTANPNTRSTIQNATGKYPGVGRYDQDKAYVCRIYLGYNVCKNFQFGLTGRWTDGQPILVFNTHTHTDADGTTQIATRPVCSRGINPTDGNFGCRESAIFNIDLHARVSWQVREHKMLLTVLCYNIYDFGNVLTEYSFPQGVRGENNRGPNMTLTIPRGILTTLKIEL